MTQTRAQLAEEAKLLAEDYTEAACVCVGGHGSRSEAVKCRTKLYAAIDALSEAADAQVAWRAMEDAPHGKRLLGIVDGVVRFIAWTKTSHVPIYGWCCVDSDPEDVDLCTPTGWMHIPAIQNSSSAGGVGEDNKEKSNG